jgi:hypothetical protein
MRIRAYSLLLCVLACLHLSANQHVGDRAQHPLSLPRYAPVRPDRRSSRGANWCGGQDSNLQCWGYCAIADPALVPRTFTSLATRRVVIGPTSQPNADASVI